MTDFSAESFSNHDQVVFVSDAPTGLRAIISIHDTTIERQRQGIAA